MPRLPHSLLRQARNISPLLPLLLQECRTLSSAQNELRWLREHIKSKKQPPYVSKALLTQLCHHRARGVPLQYLLGTQPFGELEILCRPGVLIPRPETEAYTTHLASILQNHKKPTTPLKVLDLCTGTGCIALSLYHHLSHPLSTSSKSSNLSRIQIHGIDISPLALSLSRKNLAHNIALGDLPPSADQDISFASGNVLDLAFNPAVDGGGRWDVVVSNPPYISSSEYRGTVTSRSVRNFEPRLALVPPSSPPSEIISSSRLPGSLLPEDIFYIRILEIARRVGARCVLMEVGGGEQAGRVARLARGMDSEVGVRTGSEDKGRVWERAEIWLDWVDGVGGVNAWSGREELEGLEGVEIKGAGTMRSVVCWR